jgi:hypothetical protein
VPGLVAAEVRRVGVATRPDVVTRPDVATRPDIGIVRPPGGGIR